MRKHRSVLCALPLLVIRLSYANTAFDYNDTLPLEKVEERANGGNWTALRYLARRYEKGFGGEIDYAKSHALFTKAAELSDYPDAISECEFYIGHHYYQGHGVKKDYAEALKHLSKAATGGDLTADAMACIGLIYLSGGEGVQQETASGDEWIRKAEAVGIKSSEVKVCIGKCYYDGPNGKKDYERALRHLLGPATSDKPDSEAMLYVALIYLNGGNGIVQNPALCETWLKKAAEAGSVTAKEVLAQTRAK
jgi:TPR repeat protein